MARKVYIGEDLILAGDGKSAYQIWLDQGNVGSISDFFTWLGTSNSSMTTTEIDTSWNNAS